MSPILGILASQNYPRITGSFDSIATTTVGVGGSGAITFSSIPQTYKHLQIRVFVRGTSGAGGYPTGVLTTFNGDSGANYAFHGLNGNGTTIYTPGGQSTSNIQPVLTPNGSNPANFFGANIVDILDYSNTSKYKVVRTLYGADFNSSGTVGMQSSLWQNTSGLTSITFTPDTTYTTLFAQYSSFALYGIRG